VHSWQPLKLVLHLNHHHLHLENTVAESRSASISYTVGMSLFVSISRLCRYTSITVSIHRYKESTENAGHENAKHELAGHKAL